MAKCTRPCVPAPGTCHRVGPPGYCASRSHWRASSCSSRRNARRSTGLPCACGNRVSPSSPLPWLPPHGISLWCLLPWELPWPTDPIPTSDFRSTQWRAKRSSRSSWEPRRSRRPRRTKNPKTLRGNLRWQPNRHRPDHGLPRGSLGAWLLPSVFWSARAHFW